MLGKTAGGLYWMFRFLERSENTARLIEAGVRIALTRSTDIASDWKSVVTTAGGRERYDTIYEDYTGKNAVDYLLRDTANPSSVMSSVESARTNARMVRTALTTEVWEAVNESWMAMRDALKAPIDDTRRWCAARCTARCCAMISMTLPVLASAWNAQTTQRASLM